MEAAQWVEEHQNNILGDLNTRSFLSNVDIDPAAIDLNDGTWQIAASDPVQDAGNVLTGLRLVDVTGPIDMGAESVLHTYRIYGCFDKKDDSQNDSGQVLIELGFKKRVIQE